MRRRSRIGAVLVILSLAASPATAQDKGTRTFDSVADTGAWSGEFMLGAHGIVEPLPREACTPVTCDTVTLDVRLPRRVWSKPGGMLVAIRWPSIDGGYDLDLSLYGPDGALAASSKVWRFSRNESVWIENPANGRCTAVVAAKNVLSPDPPMNQR